MPSKIVQKSGKAVKVETKETSSSSIQKKPAVKSVGSNKPEKTFYHLLAFDNGKVRVQGSYVGRSPPQAAKKVLKQLKRKGKTDQKAATWMFLRKLGSQKVSAYVGYNDVLDQPIYAYEVVTQDPKNPDQKIVTVNKTREILHDARGEPLAPKFTHTHSARVARVAVFPGGL